MFILKVIEEDETQNDEKKLFQYFAHYICDSSGKISSSSVSQSSECEAYHTVWLTLIIDSSLDKL